MIKWWDTPQDMIDSIDTVSMRWIENTFGLTAQRKEAMNALTNDMAEEFLNETTEAQEIWTEEGVVQDTRYSDDPVRDEAEAGQE